jgi:hypothetical protein
MVCHRSLRPTAPLAAWAGLALHGAFLATLLAAGGSHARVPLVWIDVPGARADRIEELCRTGAPLHWFRASLDAGGLTRLDAEGVEAVAAIRERMRRLPARTADLGSEGPAANGPVILRIDPSLRESTEWLDPSGGPSADLAAASEGDLEWQVLRRIAGLDLDLRWEEVDEFVNLSPGQNRALRSMPPNPAHPLWRLSHAFAADKVYTNAALFYGRVEDADRVFLALDLARAYEEDVLPWTAVELARLEAEGGSADLLSERRFFLRRVRSSASRIYGRLDRVLQSVDAEWHERVLLVADGSRSHDPFLAVRAWPAGEPPATASGALRELLESAGWNPDVSR